MKVAAIVVSLVALALLALWFTEHAWHSERVESNDVWTVPVSDGKTETIQVDYAVCSVDLAAYYDSLMGIFPGNFLAAEAAKDREQYHFKNLAITRIGSWAGYEVLGIVCRAADHMSIALKDAAGNLRLAYLEFGTDPPGTYVMPTIRTSGNDSLLCYKKRVPGTGNFYIEHYFFFDQQLRRPRLLDLSAIETAITKAVPSGFGVWKGGGLDIAKLKYWHYVWQRGDANCCPTGGTIALALSISDGKIVVVDSRYDPTARP